MAGTETETVGFENPLHFSEINGKAGKSLPSGDSRIIPAEADVRASVRADCRRRIQQLALAKSPTKQTLEREAQQLLSQLELPSSLVPWTMVVLSNEFWREQIVSTPPERRLLLLPAAEGDTDSPLESLRERAQSLGVRIELAAPSPAMIQVMAEGTVDAVIGIASLEVLEKGFDRILASGIPAAAVPVPAHGINGCFDANWVEEFLDYQPGESSATRDRYRELLQVARRMFAPSELAQLLPRARAPQPSPDESLSPLAQTEAIARDFLSFGGKYARPFITLAAYEALQPETSTATVPVEVKKVAISIEAFHKASLIHDDIEDGDEFRYGQPTLHEAYGVSTAINVGDYLIGLGYNLVSREAPALGAETAAEILEILSDAHLRLSEGQGTELLWRDAHQKQLSPQDALEIYALKTAPAFEAALLCGLRCAGPIADHREPLRGFCRLIGMGFQILNDLKDWRGDDDNKLAAGLDTIGGRPTLLWALALERLPAATRASLLALIESNTPLVDRVNQVRIWYQEADVFQLAHAMVDEFETQALQIADSLEPPALSDFLRHLTRLVLERPIAG